MTPLVDVVIPTRDRIGPLIACLTAIADQTLQDVHAIVVDDGSASPVAKDIPDELASRLQLTVLRHPLSRGPAAARNRAIRFGTAPYVAFVDDDVRCVPDLLEQHFTEMQRMSNRHVMIGPLKAPADWEPSPWTSWEARQLDDEYRRMAHGDYVPTWRQFHTGNAFLSREVIDEAGPFDERFTRAEDVEFAFRLAARGKSFVFNSEAIGWHYSSRTLDAWMRIPRAYAQFDVLLDEMYPSLHWLTTVTREREHRHPVLRAARALGRMPGGRGALVSALTAAAARMPRGTNQRLAMGMLSIAYDLEYGAAQSQARADALAQRLLSANQSPPSQVA